MFGSAGEIETDLRGSRRIFDGIVDEIVKHNAHGVTVDHTGTCRFSRYDDGFIWQFELGGSVFHELMNGRPCGNDLEIMNELFLLQTGDIQNRINEFPEALRIFHHKGKEFLLLGVWHIPGFQCFNIQLDGRERGFQLVCDIGNKTVIQECEFKMYGQVSENDGHGHRHGDHQDQTANKSQDVGLFGNQLRRKVFTHLFENYVAYHIPVNPEPDNEEPCELCQNKDKNEIK